MADTTKISRSYADNFDIKDIVATEIVPEYFPDIPASLRTTGMIGFVTEQISNISEDAFNTASVLFRESFPNRAQLAESIYSHAAIFQIDQVFSTAAACKFIVVLDEQVILDNVINEKYYDKDSGIYHFYIGRNTMIYIEDIPFVFDYPIQLNIVKKRTEKGDDFMFTAKYVRDSIYYNSISNVTDPYVRIRRSENKYIAIEVQCHQATRFVVEESIISNNIVNYPIIDVPYNGKLAGFDVFYKAPKDETFSYMKKLLVYSQPLTNSSFCYFQMKDDNTIRITFNSKDNYWMPEFNSELRVVLYYTNGSEGEFDTYTGTDISMIPDVGEDDLETDISKILPLYANQYLTAAQPLTASDDGRDQLELEAIQALAVEGYRTANALTTDNDLATYFGNYKYRYGNSDILFIRKRDDVYERVFSAYQLMRNGTYKYKTNSLNLRLNLSDMINCEEDIWIMEPGTLFTANEADGYAEIFRDQEKYEVYHALYEEAVRNGTIPYIDMDVPDEIPSYLDRAASYAEFKRRNGLEDKRSVFDFEGFEDMEDYEKYLKTFDDPLKFKFLLINPFLIKFRKDPNLVSTYITYIDKQYFMDFTNQNEDSFVQFILYSFKINRKFEKNKRYHITTTVGSAITVDDAYPVVAAKTRDITGNITEYVLGDKNKVAKRVDKNGRVVCEGNDLRVLFVIYNNGVPSCYCEMYPTAHDPDYDNFTYECDIFTDDYITSAGKLRLDSDRIYREYATDRYYKVHEDDNTLYDYYEADGTVIRSDVIVNEVTDRYNNGELYIVDNIVNMTSVSNILIPLEDVTCEIYTLYRRKYDEESQTLILTTEDDTNNIFAQYDETLKGYIWTNQYTTPKSDTTTFLKPLDNVRVTFTFDDYTKAWYDEQQHIHFEHDIMDAQMYNLPFIKYDIALNEDLIENFMNTFSLQYEFLDGIVDERLRNITSLDAKLYNTYGRSRYFYVGENKEILDTLNLLIEFDIFYVTGTDIIWANDQVKEFIKTDIERINENGQNNLYISNLMRKIETTFAYVDHIRFVRINNYDTTYQAIKTFTDDINLLSVEQRRTYVPEFLMVDKENIILNDYYTDDYYNSDVTTLLS